MENVISIQNLSKSFGNVKAVDDLSFRVKRGELFAFLGVNGAGKSTTISIICGQLKKDSGSVRIHEMDVERKGEETKRLLGVVFQDFRLLKDRNIYDNVAFAQKVIGESNRSIKKNVPKLLSMVGLAAKYRSYPRQLSGGEQQRVAIARALINKPKILLADEPTGNLDANNAWEIMKLMEEINEQGTTVVVVTHNLEIVKAMNKRVITMQKGVVVDDTASDHYGKDTSVEQDDDLFDDFLDDGGDDDYAN